MDVHSYHVELRHISSVRLRTDGHDIDHDALYDLLHGFLDYPAVHLDGYRFSCGGGRPTKKIVPLKIFLKKNAKFELENC